MIEGLFSVLFGAAAGGVASWLLTAWQLKRQRSDRVKDAQLDLVRRISRHKNGPELAAALNEVPVVFSGDEEALRLFLKAVPRAGGGSRYGADWSLAGTSRKGYRTSSRSGAFERRISGLMDGDVVEFRHGGTSGTGKK